MYKIEQKDYGVKLTFSGFIDKDEMQAYKDEFWALLEILPEKFGIVSDMREMKTLPPESQEIFNSHPEKVTPRLLRTATVINSSLVKIQSRRLVEEWKMTDTKRYIDASKEPNWEAVAVAWVASGVEPDDHRN